jgi:hypothetical protein
VYHENHLLSSVFVLYFYNITGYLINICMKIREILENFHAKSQDPDSPEQRALAAIPTPDPKRKQKPKNYSSKKLDLSRKM